MSDLEKLRKKREAEYRARQEKERQERRIKEEKERIRTRQELERRRWDNLVMQKQKEKRDQATKAIEENINASIRELEQKKEQQDS